MMWKHSKRGIRNQKKLKMLWIEVRKGEREKGDVAYRILLEADMHKKDWLRRC